MSSIRAAAGGRRTALCRSHWEKQDEEAVVAVVNSVAPVKPLLRGWMHLVWFEACLVLGPLALVHPHGAVRITGLAIFVGSVSAMFGVSAFYHRGNWSEAWRVRLQRGDPPMIFLLIAGTPTT